MILYLGDSLTRGIVGYSFIKFMPKAAHKNRGKDGDTVHGALKRLRRYRERKWYKDVDLCVVEIGTNDILQPFMMGRGAFWKVIFSMSPGKRWADADTFEWRMRDILGMLRGDGKSVVVMGLPMMQLKGYPYDELERRNVMLKKLAVEYGAAFADVMGAETADCPEAGRGYDWGRVGLRRGMDILTMGLAPFTKDRISERRGLELTVDGVHFNSRSARLAAGEAARAAGGRI